VALDNSRPDDPAPRAIPRARLADQKSIVMLTK
jgi:hypothetical protein